MKSIKLLTCCLLLFMLAGCRKDEFMPEVEGEKIPHEELTVTMKELLAASPYTLFKAAWQRSDMEQMIKERGSKFPYTLLVPTDAAFIADGLTLDVINSTAPALLDSILLYHTLEGNIIADDLKKSEERYIGKTLLKNPNLTVKDHLNPGGGVMYTYFQYLKVTDGELFINGKRAGKTPPVQANDGLFQPINQVLHKPTKTILEVLREDGRFGMYLEMNERADALYAELTEYSFPHDFTQGLTFIPNSNYNIVFSSIFAIPDEAFRQAGFNTVDDILALNDRNPLPYLDWNTFTVVGGFATDSLVAYHRWGTLFSPVDPSSGAGVTAPSNFYSSDLNNSLLSDYIIVSAGTNGSVSPYINPLDFSKEDGKIKVKVKGSDYPAASIVESDINTLMGPVHVVDHLLLPKGFKL